MAVPGSSAQAERPERRRPLLVLLIGLLGFLTVIGVALYSASRPNADQLLREGRRALQRDEFLRAEHLAIDAFERNPELTAALLLAATAARADGRSREAVGYCDRAPREQTAESLETDLLCAEILWKDLRLIESAEARLRDALNREPGHLPAVQALAHLLALQTRAWELIPLELQMIRGGSVTPGRLFALAVGDKMYADEKLIQAFHQADRDAAGPLLAMAQLAALRRETERARRFLERAVQSAPNDVECQVRLGALLLEQGSEGEFLAWHASLRKVPEVDAHPAVWETRGLWSARQGSRDGALRCLWESLRRDPNRTAANYQLGRLLVEDGQPEQAARFLERAQLLEEYRLLLDPGRLSGPPEITSGLCRKAATLCGRLGLPWEEFGWAVLAAGRSPAPRWAVETVQRLQPQLATQPLARAAPDANPARIVDLSHLSFPDIVIPSDATDVLPIASPAADRLSGPGGAIQFEDRAGNAGVRFAYYNDGKAGVIGMSRPFEFTGGGVAALDYDLDFWPDLYFAQGSTFPRNGGSTVHIDRLYRNAGSGRFEDVTAAAGLSEDSYSQGVAAGDVNCDGFADVYVGNVGRNRLFLNNGDGTFRDSSRMIEGDAGRWTTSAAIADLNGDGLPEICAVNYLEGADVFARVCRDETGPRGSCTPRDFEASQDQLFLNLGDGRFSDVTRESGIEAEDGKGLGVIAADFHGRGLPSLFVANDGVANFFFENITENRGDTPRFREQALLSGLAYNGSGSAEACMGVVAEDLTEDGRLDLFVTNFFDESNTLYAQRDGLLFVDGTRSAGLDAPSLKMLGFGAQAIDAELDGLADLLVTNGHVDDYSHAGIPWAMRPQFFQNVGGGRFEELSGAALGEYFEAEYLGRGMARLDWNRDGAEDAAITHLDAPAALLENQTSPRGHFVAISLRGTVSGRDAIGTSVIVRTEARALVRQLVAGDGYLSCNERRLVFGLGRADDPVSLEVRWPSGLRQTFGPAAADQHVMLVEGAARAYALNPR